MPTEASATPQQVTSLPEEGAWHIQLGAARSSDEAEREWGRLQKTAPDVLGVLTHRVQRADLGGSKGVFYRTQAGPFTDEAGAASACTKLKGVQIDCLTVKP
jgi:cell division protein FtsN